MPTKTKTHTHYDLNDEFPVFDGTRARTWMLKSCCYFKLRPNVDEQQRIATAARHFEGKAVAWYQNMANRQIQLSWKQFLSLVSARFEDLKDAKAFRELEALKHVGSYLDYAKRFEELIWKIPIGDDLDLFEDYFTSRFVDGLDDELRGILKKLQPKSLNNAIELGRKHLRVLDIIAKETHTSLETSDSCLSPNEAENQICHHLIGASIVPTRLFTAAGIKLIPNLEQDERKSAEMLSAIAFQVTKFCENRSAKKSLFDPRFEDGETSIRSNKFGPCNYDELMGSLESKKGNGKTDSANIMPGIVKAANISKVRATTKATSLTIRGLQYRPFDRGKYATAEDLCSSIKTLVCKNQSPISYSLMEQWRTHERIQTLHLSSTVSNHTQGKLSEEAPNTLELLRKIFDFSGQLRTFLRRGKLTLYSRRNERKFYQSQERCDRNFVVGKKVYLVLQLLCHNSIVLQREFKLSTLHLSPFEIWGIIDLAAHELDFPIGWKIHSTVLVVLFKKSLRTKVDSSCLVPQPYALWSNGGLESAMWEDGKQLRTKFLKENLWGREPPQRVAAFMNRSQPCRGAAFAGDGFEEVTDVAQTKMLKQDPWGQGSLQAGGIVMNPKSYHLLHVSSPSSSSNQSSALFSR